MAVNGEFDSGSKINIFIGFDSREAIASDVCAHSIRKHTQAKLNLKFLKHRDLRKSGVFFRPWMVEGTTGETIDLIDGKKFSTEFSHTRFLVPHLMGYRGWALFCDADMIFLSDIAKLWQLRDDKYAVMCVQHNHNPSEQEKMDGREQSKYYRKNWSSFMLWNCGHPANRYLTPEKVSFMKGSDLHRFAWLHNAEIGALPYSYNFISGVSPKAEPHVIHYTEGGPWFPECQNVPYAELWIEAYENMQASGALISSIPSVAYEKEDRVKK